ncbi:MAG: hypothetical protein JSS44_11350 [Proteobacteria bacterium]|nr:hypothetical protein [Pseudomonadota bacterium]
MINDDRHPLYRVRRPIYWTGPAEDLGEAINVGIEFNRHGIIVRGDGRIGKTEGLGLLSRETKWRNYGMFWQRVLSPLPGQSTEGYFFNEIRLAACLKIRERSQSIFGVHHATDFFCESAAMIDAEVIVVSFDDANRLQREDYDHLATLDSHIAERGFRLFVVLMMQADADGNSAEETAEQPWPSQITGRFTADRYLYTGLRGRKEFKEALRTFANQRWPAETGPTFLERFAGAACALGWHVEQQSDMFYDAVEEARSKADLVPDAPFPMQCFDTATYYLTVRVAGENANFARFTPEDFKKAVELSGLVALELSRRPKDKK